MKKTLKVLGGVAFAAIMFFNVNVIVNGGSDINLESIVNMANADIESGGVSQCNGDKSCEWDNSPSLGRYTYRTGLNKLGQRTCCKDITYNDRGNYDEDEK